MPLAGSQSLIRPSPPHEARTRPSGEKATQTTVCSCPVSVRFGAYYMAQQRDRFDGDLFAALAAYNAGPGNASIWKELAPDDPDLYLEVIRLSQPHLYIRRIYETYTIYRQLYTVGD